MLGQMRAERLILTLGERGAEVHDAGARQVVAAPQVEAVDTTAAGDAFVGALAVALAAGDDLLAGVRLAVLAGAAAVMRRGARESLPTTDALKQLFGEAWRK
jgi:ribokinase